MSRSAASPRVPARVGGRDDEADSICAPLLGQPHANAAVNGTAGRSDDGALGEEATEEEGQKEEETREARKREKGSEKAWEKTREERTGSWHESHRATAQKQTMKTFPPTAAAASPSAGIAPVASLRSTTASSTAFNYRRTSTASSSATAATTTRSMHARSPKYLDDARQSARQRYVYAGIFLALSLASFVVQTETAVYIQKELGWVKPYCMLYLTHGSWIFLYPAQLLILRYRRRHVSATAFWRRHIQLVHSTAQMTQSRELRLSQRAQLVSPIPYLFRTVATVTCALTVAGCSWYVAVDLTTPSDLTAIYNCSAFFAYAFSIPLLGDRLRVDKVFSVLVATVGVLIIAYAPAPDSDSGSDSDSDTAGSDASNRALGNVVIGVGSVLYGLYEVLYKRLACPPEGTSAGRGVIFANTVASLIGLFTLLFLWLPLPLLHWSGLEPFELPDASTAVLLAISTLSNAVFSGSFLVLISLTSPVLSSVAALLTIFLVAVVDWVLHHRPLGFASLLGGLLIVCAFLLMAWSTFREMAAENRKMAEAGHAEAVVDVDSEDEDEDEDGEDEDDQYAYAYDEYGERERLTR
ncbi:hypothetical protein KEM52_001473 [Ascosphaera acerosa]|nr:hypothetical protein KEM52_001473 [Ascosphaera acerosa]